jgi:preprotein translocase subunit SecA
VLDHLELAQVNMQRAWGISEWRRLSNSSPAELDEKIQRRLQAALGEIRYEQVCNQPLGSLEDSERLTFIEELGRQALTEIHRQLLLAVITELWVDYLTQMEALRVSIGLEAYAQRDPLVQYKSRASELFQTLLNNMRSGVVTRMFTYRPRDLSSVQATVGRADQGQIESGLSVDGEEQESLEGEAVEEDGGEEAVTPAGPANTGKEVRQGGGKKRRRHRR